MRATPALRELLLVVVEGGAAGIVRKLPVERVGDVRPLPHRGVGEKLEDVSIRVGDVETPEDDAVNGAQDRRLPLEEGVETPESAFVLHRERQVNHPQAAGAPPPGG